MYILLFNNDGTVQRPKTQRKKETQMHSMGTCSAADVRRSFVSQFPFRTFVDAKSELFDWNMSSMCAVVRMSA